MKPDNRHYLGISHNAAFFANPCPLILDDSCQLIEMGLQDLIQYSAHPYLPSASISLHLARSPITEDKNSQDAFLKKIRSFIANKNLASIGFHLTGPRREGIGRYGFSSHYETTTQAEERAIRFIKETQDLLALPVWIENANFYSKNFADIRATWHSLANIIDQTEAQVILDVSHLAIDTLNLGIRPECIFGLIPFESVIELHLSGIIEGKDGVYHDGHSVPMSDVAFDLADHIRKNFLPAQKYIYMTLEHSDPDWVEDPKTYAQDLERVKTLLEVSSGPSRNAYGDAEFYAQSYLSKLIARRIPGVANLFREKNIPLSKVVRMWTDQILKEDKQVVLSEIEVSLSGDPTKSVSIKDFPEFLKRALKS